MYFLTRESPFRNVLKNNNLWFWCRVLADVMLNMSEDLTTPFTEKQKQMGKEMSHFMQFTLWENLRSLISTFDVRFLIV